MKLRIGNISSLQFFQLIRFSTLFLIGIVFTKSGLLQTEIGEYETILFIAGAVSFFWLNGLIQSLLSSFNKGEKKSSQFPNIFLLLSCISILTIIFLIVFQKSFSQLLLSSSKIPFLNYLLAYIFFSFPAGLTEYILLLKNRFKSIVWYGSVSFFLMFIMVGVPAIITRNMEFSLIGLVISSFIRYVWLWVLLSQYSKWKISWGFIADHLKLSWPLILSALLSGSAQYIDGFIVSSHFDEAKFAIFRYGAREFPLVILLANTFSTAMIPKFLEKEKLQETLSEIKKYSRKLMHGLFPVSIIILLLTHILFPVIFNNEFKESATIFNIYLLLIISRLIFPQTILIGLKQNKIIATASFFEIIINVLSSLWFVSIWGLSGIAYGTIVAYVFEKFYLSFRLVKKTGISVNKYMDVSLHLTYSVILIIAFYVVEFVIY